MSMLTLEQYTILNEQRDKIESWKNTKYAPKIPIEWIKKMNGIYVNALKRPPADWNCDTCLGIALIRILDKLLEYESEQKRLQDDLQKRVEADESNGIIKKKGREPKNWLKDEKGN